MLRRAWSRTPMTLRAVISGLAFTAVGNLPWGALFTLNARLAPRMPWSIVPALLIVLAFLVVVISGRSRVGARLRERLHTNSPSRAVWLHALLAGSMALTSVFLLTWLAERAGMLAPHPLAPRLPLGPMSLVLVVLTNGIVAGVVEEAGYRGVMQTPIERAHGLPAAIAIVGVVFALSHLAHAWVSLAHLPFYFAASAVYSLLAARTGSILPGMALHAAGDVILPLLAWWRLRAHGGSATAGLGVAWPAIACAAIVAAALAAWTLRRIEPVAVRGETR